MSSDSVIFKPIVHCMGGTGRTGTIIIGAVHNLGFDNPVKHCRQYGKSSYLEIANQETYLESVTKVATKKMFEENPILCYKIVFDQLEDLCSSHNGVVDAVGGSEEQSHVWRQIFDEFDNATSHKAADGIMSITQFIDSFATLASKHDINPEAFHSITAEKLRMLFSLEDPMLKDVAFDQDSITFELFEKTMNKRPVLSSKKMS
jgi:hypothetical protein